MGEQKISQKLLNTLRKLDYNGWQIETTKGSRYSKAGVPTSLYVGYPPAGFQNVPPTLHVSEAAILQRILHPGSMAGFAHYSPPQPTGWALQLVTTEAGILRPDLQVVPAGGEFEDGE
jgi:hypothetical protein